MDAAFPTLDFDHAPEEVILFDVETQSAADLREVGGRIYAADPTTRPLVSSAWWSRSASNARVQRAASTLSRTWLLKSQ